MTRRGEARFRAFGVGCAKTGTSSLARMFRRHYCSKHEPSSQELLALILNRPRMTETDFCESVRAALAPLDLEMNASQINGYIVDTMVKLFPQAKFILTIREPRAWVLSFANHQATRKSGAADSRWMQFRDLRFRPGGGPAGGKQLYSIDEYLAYWVAHNAAVMRAVPPDQLLIVSTERLEREIPRLASFLGVPENTITPARANEGTYAAETEGYFDQQLFNVAVRNYASQLSDLTGFDVHAMTPV